MEATPPAAQPPAQSPAAAPAEPDRGFFGSLFDTRFDNLITPSIVRFVYIVIMVIIAIGYLIAVIAGFANKPGSGVLILILGPIGALLYLIAARIYLEVIIVLFKIRESSEEIAHNTRR